MKQPHVTILLMTYAQTPNSARTGYAVTTIANVAKNLKYDGDLHFYVADSGSHEYHLSQVLTEIEATDIPLLGYHSESLTPGASWNKGLVACYSAFPKTPIVLMLEDDWKLERPFDITPYVDLLLQNTNIGMVRLSWLNVGIRCEIAGWNGIHYLIMIKEKDRQHTYSGNPHLRHVRFDKHYGPFDEEIAPSPGDVEIDFDSRYRANPDGSHIIRPADLGGWGPWGHIGTVQSYKDEQDETG